MRRLIGSPSPTPLSPSGARRTNSSKIELLFVFGDPRSRVRDGGAEPVSRTPVGTGVPRFYADRHPSPDGVYLIALERRLPRI